MGGSGTAESAGRDPCPPRLDTLYFREVPIKSQPSATKGREGPQKHVAKGQKKPG